MVVSVAVAFTVPITVSVAVSVAFSVVTPIVVPLATKSITIIQRYFLFLASEASWKIFTI